MQKKILISLAMLLAAWPFLLAQQTAIDSFPQHKAALIMNVLAGDSLRGRGNLTEDLVKAGRFIVNEFRETGLRPLPGASGFFDAFQPFGGPAERKREELYWNDRRMDWRDFLYLAADPGKHAPLSLKDFTVVHVDSFRSDLLEQYNDEARDILFWSETAVKKWGTLRMPSNGINAARLLVHSTVVPQNIQLRAGESYFRSIEYNIVGMLPGKTRPEEYVIFSSHYDHEGVLKKGNDTIMNGANDNASGTTALLMLARYFALRNDNERTLIFCAFAGEELGLKGSADLSRRLISSSVKAGINLEMLGLPQYGTKKIFITGQRYSSLPALLGKQLGRFGVSVISEPSEGKRLFRRSDNYPFAVKGVPFHTIMASDDDEPCYHKPCDEAGRMDLANLCFITKAIAQATAILISGEATPGRITDPVIE